MELPTFTFVSLVSESPHEVTTAVTPSHHTNVAMQLYECVCVCERERERKCVYECVCDIRWILEINLTVFTYFTQCHMTSHHAVA